jgi:hypothetical protein
MVDVDVAVPQEIDHAERLAGARLDALPAGLAAVRIDLDEARPAVPGEWQVRLGGQLRPFWRNVWMAHGWLLTRRVS